MRGKGDVGHFICRREGRGSMLFICSVHIESFLVSGPKDNLFTNIPLNLIKRL